MKEIKRPTARAMIRTVDVMAADQIKELEALPALHPDKEHLGDWYEIRRKVEEAKRNWGFSQRAKKPREPQPSAAADALAAFDRPGVVWGRA